MMLGLGCFLLAAAVVHAQDSLSQSSSSFQLYAYAPGVGGLPIFNADGMAYAGDPNRSNSTQAAVVTFISASEKTYSGNPNMTGLDSSKSPSWSNATLYIPSTGSSSSRVGFANSSSGIGIETGFVFYGGSAMFIANDGALQSSWMGLRGDNGVYSLYWNDTSQGQIPLAIRRIAPSNPPLTPHFFNA